MKRKHGIYYHVKIRESLLEGLYIYQYRPQTQDNFIWELELPDYNAIQIQIILIACLELVYAFLMFIHSYRIKNFPLLKLDKFKKKAAKK